MPTAPAKKTFTRKEISQSAILFAVVLFVLPAFGPHAMLTGSAFAMVAWVLVFRRHLPGSKMIPLSLTACLAVMAAVSVFGA